MRKRRLLNLAVTVIALAAVPGTALASGSCSSGGCGLLALQALEELVSLIGLMIVISGIAWMYRPSLKLEVKKKCNCNKQEENLRAAQQNLQSSRAWLAREEADLDAAQKALPGWKQLYLDLVALEAKADVYAATLPAKLKKWAAYLKMLQSLLGPMLVAGRDWLSTTAQPGWTEVVPGHLWASSDQAARAIAPYMEVMKTIMVGGPGGPHLMGLVQARIAAAQQAIAEGQAALKWAFANKGLFVVEEAKALKTIQDLESRILGTLGNIELAQNKVKDDEAKWEQAMADLEACKAGTYPHCPDPSLPPIIEIDVVDDHAPIPAAQGAPSPAPPAPGDPPTGDGMTGGAPPKKPEHPDKAGQPDQPDQARHPAEPLQPGPVDDTPPVRTDIPVRSEDKPRIDELARRLHRIREQIKVLEGLEQTGLATQEVSDALTALRKEEAELQHQLTELVIESNHAAYEAERKKDQERLAREAGVAPGTAVKPRPEDVKKMEDLKQKGEALQKEIADLKSKEREGKASDEQRKRLSYAQQELHELDDELGKAANALLTHVKEDAEAARKAAESKAMAPDQPGPAEPAKPKPVEKVRIKDAPPLTSEDQEELLKYDRALKVIEDRMIELRAQLRRGELDAGGIAALEGLKQEYGRVLVRRNALIGKAKERAEAAARKAREDAERAAKEPPKAGPEAPKGTPAAEPAQGAGTGAAAGGAEAGKPDPLQSLVSGWLKERLKITDPADPLHRTLMQIGKEIGLEKLRAILEGSQSKEPIGVLAEAMAGVAATRGATPETFAMLQHFVNLLDQVIGDKSLQTKFGVGSTADLQAVRKRLADQLAGVTRELLEHDHSEIDQMLGAIGSHDAPVEVRAKQLEQLKALLQHLDTLSAGSPRVKEALRKAEQLGEQLAAELKGAVEAARTTLEDAARRQALYRRVLEKVDKLDFTFTKPEEEVLDQADPDWRARLGLDAITQTKGTHARPHLLPKLRRLVVDADADAAAVTQRLTNLEYLRLTQSKADPESAAIAARAAADAMVRDLIARGEGASYRLQGQLAVARALSAAADLYHFSGNSYAIRQELDLIYKDLNGYTTPAPSPEERQRFDGAREFVQKTDPNSTAGHLAREWAAYLQQRRSSLIQLDPANAGVEGASRALKLEMERDIAYWKAQRPWDELRWLTGTTDADKAFEEATGALIYQLPEYSRQIALTQNDPKAFIRFLTMLQKEKIERGDAAWEAYQDTPLARRGLITQTWRLSHAAENVEKMLADQQMLSALQYGASLPLDKIREDYKALLKEKGFIETGEDGQERLAIPKELKWEPSVGEQLTERDWTDEVFNLEHLSQLAATFYLGGWAAEAVEFMQAARGASLIARMGWWTARTASEATIFTVLQKGLGSMIKPESFFRADLKGLLREWAENLVAIGGLNLAGPALKALEEELLAGRGVQELAGVAAKDVRSLTREDLKDLLLRLGGGGARSIAEAAGQTAVGVTIDQLLGNGGREFGLAALSQNLAVILQMKALGLLGKEQADDLYRQAREHGRRIVRARNAYGKALKEAFESARAAGREKLDDVELARLAEARQQIESAASSRETGNVNLKHDFKDLESELSQQYGIEIGEAGGSWRKLLGDPEAQRALFGGKTLLEALQTVDPMPDLPAGRPVDPGIEFELKYGTALRAVIRFMQGAGKWVSVKGAISKASPEVAKALFGVRKAWAEYICKQYDAKVIGTVESMMNDCDFNFALGKTPETFNPVPRMQAAARWTDEMVKRLLKDQLSPEELAGLKYGDLLETNSYTDPAIIHLYTRAQLSGADRARVVDDLTRSSLGLAKFMLEHDLQVPEPVRNRILDALRQAGIDPGRLPTADEIAEGVGVPHWDKEAGIEALLQRQNTLFDWYAGHPEDPEVVRLICEIQMLLNAQAEGAYPTPGAALLTVSIKEGATDPAMKALKDEMKPFKERLSQLEEQLKPLLPTKALKEAAKRHGYELEPSPEVLRLQKEMEQVRSEMAPLQKRYEELRRQNLKHLSPGEALQSVLGDTVFFWHMVKLASPREWDAFEATLRYELSKYAARLLEVGNLFGMDPRAGVAGDARFLGIARLLKTATRIYKDHTTGEVFEGPAYDNMQDLKEYFASIEAATLDVIRFLAEKAVRPE